MQCFSNRSLWRKTIGMVPLFCILFASFSYAWERDQEYEAEVGLSDSNAHDAYDRGYTGKGITIAVIDSGINLSHREFLNRNISVYDTVTHSTSEISDAYGHGSAVAGILAANRDGVGMHGMAFNSNLLCIKFFDLSGDDQVLARLIDANQYVLTSQAKIVNNSWVLGDKITEITKEQALEEYGGFIEMQRSLVEDNRLLIFGAGNTAWDQVSQQAGLPYLFPELQKGLLAVVALQDIDGVISFASGYSNQAGVAKYWTIAAQGGAGPELMSQYGLYTVAEGAEKQRWGNANSDYARMAGTSLAAPVVSGAAALVWEAFPYFTNQQVAQTLLTTAQDMGDPGPDEIYGWGQVDVGKAVKGPALFTRITENGSIQFNSSFDVNTQGYNSTFDNDIAGNAGLTKRGAGILRLTGTNTYQGSSVAAGGVLQIDGSVAGDVYSVDSGTIGGLGTIQSNLYNHAVVQPGSYGNSGTLTVNGNLESTGNIAVAMNSTAYSKLSVAGVAAIAGTGFTAVAGSTYHPGTYTGVLKANSITGDFKETAAFTGMLSATADHDGTTATLTLQRANNLNNPTSMQLQAYNQVEAMYDALEGQSQQRELDSLYSLSALQANQALTEIAGGAQLNQAIMVQSSTALSKAIAGRLNAVAYPVSKEVNVKLDGSMPSDLTAKTIISLDSNDSWWMNISKNWGSMDARRDLPSLSNQSFSFVIGRDEKNHENWRTGFLFGYENNNLASSLAKTQSHGYRLGMYAGYNHDAVEVQTHLVYGRQNNDAKRYLTQLGLEANSKYDSDTISLGVKARYHLQQGQDKAWQVNPYTDVNVTWYDQDRYKESGAGVYNQEADPFSNTYSTGEFGLELARNLPKGHLAVNVGYKKVLSGSDPNMTIAYSGNPNSKLAIRGNQQDSEYAVLGLNYQAELAKDWNLSAQIDSEQGSHSKNLTASIAVKRVW